MEYTSIAGRQVPVLDGPRTVVYFSGECNPKDPAGDYDFWTMKNEARKLRVGRRRIGAPPGERFRQMQHNPADAEGWKEAQTAILIRPTSAEELIEWLNDPTKAKDAPCAKHGSVKGTPMKVVPRSDGKYDLEPT